MLRDALRVVNIVERAAAMLRGAFALQFWQAALIPQLHGEANDGTRLLLQNGSDGRGVDSAGHCDGDEAGTRFSARGKYVELCCGGHPFLFYRIEPSCAGRWIFNTEF